MLILGLYLFRQIRIIMDERYYEPDDYDYEDDEPRYEDPFDGLLVETDYEEVLDDFRGEIKMVTEQQKDRALNLLNMMVNAKNEVEAEAASEAMIKQTRKDQLEGEQKQNPT